MNINLPDPKYKVGETVKYTAYGAEYTGKVTDVRTFPSIHSNGEIEEQNWYYSIESEKNKITSIQEKNVREITKQDALIETLREFGVTIDEKRVEVASLENYVLYDFGEPPKLQKNVVFIEKK